MKNIHLLILLCLSYSSAWAQLTNNGASIIIEQGASLIVEGTDLLHNSGTINNSGELTVEGDLIITDNFTSDTPASKIIFKGTSNSTFSTNILTVYTLENEKEDADINLLGHLTIEGSLDFTSSTNSESKINIDNHNLIIETGATISGTSSQKYISTNGNGFLHQILDAAGTYTFPVGNTNGMTELTANITGSSFTNASVKVKVNPMADASLPADASDYIARHWEMTVTNLPNYQSEVEGKYLSSDIVGTESLIKGASLSSSNWSYQDADRTSNTVKGTITAVGANFTGSNFYGKVNPKAYLQGSYAGGGLMTTALSDQGLIPLSSPYTDAPATATSIPAGTVDWVKVELRDPNTPSTSVAKQSGFLLADGSIVDLDGSSLLTIKDAPTSSYLAIYHRNHLPIRASILSDLSDPTLLDLSAAANLYTNPAITTNTPVKSLGGLISGLWSGDVNGNHIISYNGGGNDRTSILVKVGFLTPNNTAAGYFKEDVNLNGSASYNGGGNDRTPILVNVGFLTPNKILSAHID